MSDPEAPEEAPEATQVEEQQAPPPVEQPDPERQINAAGEAELARREQEAETAWPDTGPGTQVGETGPEMTETGQAEDGAPEQAAPHQDTEQPQDTESAEPTPHGRRKAP